MKPIALQEKYLTDARGKRVGVVLDLTTYARLRDAAEELADIRNYDAARPKVMAQVAKGRFATLAQYRAAPRRKAQ